MSSIIVSGLTKDYGDSKGIFDLNFTIKEGEVFGYLGPNGAGKTTTIRHLLGFLNPDKGSCKIGTFDCRKESAEIQKDMGFLPGEMAFFDEMKGIDFLKFMASMRGLKDFTKMNELINLFELDPSGRIKRMSKGMKQKMGIVTAFMHNPTTLILDEPTSGLDPLMQNKFVGLIKKEKAAGRTILMSSHSFEEVERTCDRVGIIKNGRFVATKTVADLKTQRRKVYSVTFEDIAQAESFAKENLKIVYQHENVVNVAVSGSMQPFIHALDSHPVVGLDTVSQNLEEIFMGYYGNAEGDGDKNA